MKVLGNLPIEDKTISNVFPFGATIKNETETEYGTPVVREIYGDVLMNLYKVLQEANILPNGLEDSTDNGFQLVDAFKKLKHFTDGYQTLILSGQNWQINNDLTPLGQSYYLVGKASENYQNGQTYNFSGTESDFVSFESPTGFNSGDPILIIRDGFNVNAYSLGSGNNVKENVFTTLGTPLSYNSSNKMYYLDSGNILEDYPKSTSILNLLRVASGDDLIEIIDVYYVDGYFISAVESNGNLEFYQTSEDFSSTILLNGYSETFTDLFVYFGDGKVFINNSNNELKSYVINLQTNTITEVGLVELDSSFENTTNYYINDTKICTFINGDLRKYDILSGAFLNNISLRANSGQLFAFNKNSYFTSGEIGRLWLL